MYCLLQALSCILHSIFKLIKKGSNMLKKSFAFGPALFIMLFFGLIVSGCDRDDDPIHCHQDVQVQIKADYTHLPPTDQQDEQYTCSNNLAFSAIVSGVEDFTRIKVAVTRDLCAYDYYWDPDENVYVSVDVQLVDQLLEFDAVLDPEKGLFQDLGFVAKASDNPDDLQIQVEVVE